MVPERVGIAAVEGEGEVVSDIVLEVGLGSVEGAPALNVNCCDAKGCRRLSSVD